MKIRLALILVLCIPPTMRAAEPEAHHADAGHTIRLTPAYVNALAEQMRTNHPALRALDARVRAAAHATNAVRTWDDPMFKVGGVVTSPRSFRTSEEGDLIYGVDQKLPLFGKAAAVRRVAQAGAESEVARQAMQFQFLRRDLAKLLFKAAYEERALDVGRQDLAWLDTMVATTEARYRGGAGSQVELLRLQNERARRADLLRTDTLHRDHSWLAMNRLLNRDLNAPLSRFELPSVGAPVVYSSNLVGFAVRFEPKLRVMAREIGAAEAQAAATRTTRLPDVSAGIESRQYSGDGGFREGMFTVSLSLPWFNRGKYRSDYARDRARLEAAELDRADYELTVREDIHRLTVDIDAARREALLYGDEILPRSQQALDSAHASWLGGRGMFNDVMESRRMLLEAQLLFARAVSTQYQAMSELVLCCGLGDLEALELFGVIPDPTPPQP